MPYDVCLQPAIVEDVPREKPIKRKRGTVDPQEYAVVKETKPTVC